MKKYIIFAALLSGCATGNFANRLSCTVDRTQASLTSWYMGFGIGTQIDQRDSTAVCGVPPPVNPPGPLPAAAAASGIK